MLLLCYFLLALFLVTILASYINFARVNLQIGKCPEVFVGDNLHIPLWLNANDNGVAGPNGQLNFKLRSQQQSSKKKKRKTIQTDTFIDVNAFSNPINLSQKCQKRGKLTLSRVTLECYYPLGLYRCWTHLAFTHQITVFPKPIPCDIKLQVNERNSSKKSGELVNEQTGHDDFSHLKAYQLGEPLNHVAWKQLAKGRGMVSKQFSTTGNHIGWLKLSSQHRYNDQLNNDPQLNTALEKELSELCYQVIELSRTQSIFGLDLGAQCIAPNSGTTHRSACLLALADFPNGGN